MGSSMVMMWVRRFWLIWLIMAARVVDLPLPVAPVTRISPRFRAAIFSSTLGRFSSSKLRALKGISRSTAA